MHDLVLTPDNLQLSRVNRSKAAVQDSEHFAINCKPNLLLSAETLSLTDAASDLLSYASAPNTLRAYESDMRHYRGWGGTLPAAPAEICAYIGQHAGQLAVGTILRRIATLSKAHSAANLPNPCTTEIVKSTLRGLKRKHGTAQKQARPLMRDELFLVLDRLGDGLRDQRDRA